MIFCFCRVLLPIVSVASRECGAVVTQVTHVAQHTTRNVWYEHEGHNQSVSKSDSL